MLQNADAVCSSARSKSARAQAARTPRGIGERRTSASEAGALFTGARGLAVAAAGWLVTWREGGGGGEGGRGGGGGGCGCSAGLPLVLDLAALLPGREGSFACREKVKTRARTTDETLQTL